MGKRADCVVSGGSRQGGSTGAFLAREPAMAEVIGLGVARVEAGQAQQQAQTHPTGARKPQSGHASSKPGRVSVVRRALRY